MSGTFREKWEEWSGRARRPPRWDKQSVPVRGDLFAAKAVDHVNPRGVAFAEAQGGACRVPLSVSAGTGFPAGRTAVSRISSVYSTMPAAADAMAVHSRTGSKKVSWSKWISKMQQREKRPDTGGARRTGVQGAAAGGLFLRRGMLCRCLGTPRAGNANSHHSMAQCHR